MPCGALSAPPGFGVAAVEIGQSAQANDDVRRVNLRDQAATAQVEKLLHESASKSETIRRLSFAPLLRRWPPSHCADLLD